MFLKKNTKNLCSLLTIFAIFGLAITVLWFSANAETTNADSSLAKASGSGDSPSAIFPGTGVGAIPDGNPGTPPQFGAPLTINFEVSGVPIVNFIALDITMTHTWVGDLEIILRSPGGVAQHSIVNRVGAISPNQFGDSSNYGGTYTFNDVATSNIWAAAIPTTCGDNCVVAPGAYRTTGAGSGTPTNFLAAFAGLTQAQANGTWTLTIRDAGASDTGSVTAANLHLLTGGDPTPPPTSTPPLMPTPTGTATSPDPHNDLTISQSAAPDPVTVGQPLTYTLTARLITNNFGVSLLPTIRFNFPRGVPFSFNSARGTNGYTATPDANGVTFTGGNISATYMNLGAATFKIVITPQAAGTLTSAGEDVLVDSNNTIHESYENNNTAQTVTTTVRARSRVANTFDFSGEGRADYVVFRVSNRFVYASRGDGSLAFAFPFGIPGDDIWTPGDYDGDGRTDIAIWRRSTGVFYVARSLDNTVIGFQFGAPGDEPIPRDYDGDGRTDFAVVRRANGLITWFIQNSQTNTFRAVNFGAASDVVAPGDYDGDGRFDLAVFRGNGSTQAATFFVMQSSSGGFTAQQFGLGSDLVVPGDYDGDGRTDFAVVRTGTAYDWYILRSSDGALQFDRLGGKSFLTVQSDYDGDGRTDVAVYDPSAGVFYVRRSSDFGLTQLTFGQSGDYPIANFDTH